MKLFKLLSLETDDQWKVCGIYSSREKALEAMESNIEEIEEAYEDYFWCSSFGESYGIFRRRPSDIEPEYLWKNEGPYEGRGAEPDYDADAKLTPYVRAYGKTKEEATAKAVAALACAHPVWEVWRDGGRVRESRHADISRRWGRPDQGVVHEDLETARKMFAEDAPWEEIGDWIWGRKTIRQLAGIDP